MTKRKYIKDPTGILKFILNDHPWIAIALFIAAMMLWEMKTTEYKASADYPYSSAELEQ